MREFRIANCEMSDNFRPQFLPVRLDDEQLAGRLLNTCLVLLIGFEIVIAASRSSPHLAHVAGLSRVVQAHPWHGAVWP